MHNFKKLKVYDRSIAFASLIYHEARHFPGEERYGLTSQLRRAASSIALNIAEGTGSASSREFGRFLDFSIRSGYECIACCDIALRVSYLSEASYAAIVKEVEEIIAMLVGLKRSLRTTSP